MDRPKVIANRYCAGLQGERTAPFLFMRIRLSNGKGHLLPLPKQSLIRRNPP